MTAKIIMDHPYKANVELFLVMLCSAVAITSLILVMRVEMLLLVVAVLVLLRVVVLPLLLLVRGA